MNASPITSPARPVARRCLIATATTLAAFAVVEIPFAACSTLEGASFGRELPVARADAKLKAGDAAPTFTVKQDDGSSFDLASRKGKGWTVLYFYPKAETPGCTAQACAFRDSIKSIRDQGAEVYGVSTDPVPALAAFKKKHNLNFPLLSDEKAQIVEKYGVKMPLVAIARRWTFVVDPELRVRWIDNEVDPAKDAANVAAKLKELKAAKGG